MREGSKITLMGQNGSGKSTILKLLSGELSPDDGSVHLTTGQNVAVAKQTMSPVAREMTVQAFFQSQFNERNSLGAKLEREIARSLEAVDLVAPTDRVVKSFSGGQQARLLLAAALVVNPSIILLDEPTNNLDTAGINHLRNLIINTDKTCCVISHDEDFLNSFTDAVLYLDVFSQKVETYAGDYWYVKSEIEARRERENSANQRLAKEAQKKKDQAGVFANKGGGLRAVAKRMRDLAADMESQLVQVRKEDVALNPFQFPATIPTGTGRDLVTMEKISSRCATGSGEMVPTKISSNAGQPIKLGKKARLHIRGPNGCGKTTFLEMVTKHVAEGVRMKEGAVIGYYRQDFTQFDFSWTVMQCLEKAGDDGITGVSPQVLRKTAAKFLLTGDIANQTVATLSEGQKALMSLACLVLQKPTVLIMDEPTNHVNFRHLPALASAIRDFDGAVICVSHDVHFMEEIGMNNELDMGLELGLGKTAGGKSEKKKKKKKKKKKQDMDIFELPSPSSMSGNGGGDGGGAMSRADEIKMKKMMKKKKKKKKKKKVEM